MCARRFQTCRSSISKYTRSGSSEIGLTVVLERVDSTCPLTEYLRVLVPVVDLKELSDAFEMVNHTNWQTVPSPVLPVRSARIVS